MYKRQTVDRPAQDGDFTSIDMVAKIGDEEIDSVSGVSYQIGSGSMLEGMDEALNLSLIHIYGIRIGKPIKCEVQLIA